MKTNVSFPLVEEAQQRPGVLGVLRGGAHRITWKALLLTSAVTVAVLQIQASGAFGPVSNKHVPSEMWLSRLVIEAMAAFCILVGVKIAEEKIDRGASRTRAYAAGVLLGAAVAAILQWYIRSALGLRVITTDMDVLVRVTQPAVVFLDVAMWGGLATFVYANARAAHAANARRREAEIARMNTRRRTLESRLQAMQARVEPQFLFNTLAQVKELYDRDASLATQMLDDLIAYLRAALPQLRETTSTLKKEIELVRSYLGIMRVRLGDRLSFQLDLPADIVDARIPPMMLLPLVDHALVYGLGPAHDAGRVGIETSVSDGKLRLTIADSGAGFVPGAEAAGLATIEERLRALYGDDGRLILDRAADRGTTATMEIPYETS